MLVIFVSLGASAFLAASQFLLYRYTGILSVKADAFHSTADLFAGALVLVTCKFHLDRFPRLKVVSGVGIACLILLTAAKVVNDVFSMPRPETVNLVTAMVVTLGSIAISYSLGRYKIKIGKEESFSLLVMEGRHTMTDSLSSFVVLISIIGQKTGIQIDGPCALVISALLFWMALSVVRDTLFEADCLPSFNLNRIPLLNPFILLAAASIFYAFSGLHRVQEGETGIVERFGRFNRIETQGLHCHLPVPFEMSTILDVGLVRRFDIGVQNVKTQDTKAVVVSPEGTTPLPGTDSNYLHDFLCFTGDQNLVNASFAVYFHICEPLDYLYQVERAMSILEALSESAITAIFAQSELEHILGNCRDIILMKMRDMINNQSKKMNLGIRVLHMAYLGLHPPTPVIPAFRMVASAKEDRERYINEAETNAYRIAANGRASGQEIIKNARAYAHKEIARVESETARIKQFQTIKKTHGEGIECNLDLEAFQSLHKAASKIFFTDPYAPIYIDIRKEEE